MIDPVYPSVMTKYLFQIEGLISPYRFLSGGNTIACKTPVNPWAEESRSFSVEVEVLVGNDRDNSKSFTYRWGSTPRVSLYLSIYCHVHDRIYGIISVLHNVVRICFFASTCGMGSNNPVELEPLLSKTFNVGTEQVILGPSSTKPV